MPELPERLKDMRDIVICPLRLPSLPTANQLSRRRLPTDNCRPVPVRVRSVAAPERRRDLAAVGA